ncbi:MAG: ligase-associated DNA damage response DEXH box helicase [Cytophagaceae bacterium]|nr:ligase-associated DNA damage response DEXH box helicase [Cytophagaceae bacterium]
MKKEPHSLLAFNERLSTWFHEQGWQVFEFQRQTWEYMRQGKSGLVNAPTGSGKTYSVFLGALMEAARQKQWGQGSVQVVWVTPIRALALELELAMDRALRALDVPWRVAVRTGDTSAAQKASWKKKPSEILITTPESLHILFSQKGYPQLFKNVQTIVVDEWHELMGSKRGVQTELAISRVRGLSPGLRVWGISATIGNLHEAMDALLGSYASNGVMVRSQLPKEVHVQTLMPDEIEHYPWAGHLGIRLIGKILPIIDAHVSTLIFTNTRAQAEIWYQQLLDYAPQLAGVLALHHGSLSQELRHWVEQQLHEGKLKAVICTSSLDLGVDFRPVQAVIQIGSPKGVARFMQRAGRSGHQPGAISTLYFLPTNSLEIIEGAAMREAWKDGITEERIPYIRSFDVLSQYLLTLAVSEGMKPEEIFNEIKSTYSYASVTDAEWAWVLQFISQGSQSLAAYEEYKKASWHEGILRVTDRRTAMRHRLSIGTIVSDSMLRVVLKTGKRLGSIEEWFVSRLNPGDVFWFAGISLEFMGIHHMEVMVQKSKSGKGIVPSYQGGRMPLSSLLSGQIRKKIQQYLDHHLIDEEVQKLVPLFQRQQQISHVPKQDELLIEYLVSDEGYHLFCYPFEGRYVHEGLAVTMAHQLGQLQRSTFSIAMNDYGFELLSDTPIPIADALQQGLLDFSQVLPQLRSSLNASEMAARRFREIASIAGLVFQGYPGKSIKTRHLQANAQLFFEVFKQYEPDNILLQQAYEEVLIFQLEINRLKQAYDRLQHQHVILKNIAKPSPFSFPILTDRLREKYSNESLSDRIAKLKKSLE